MAGQIGARLARIDLEVAKIPTAEDLASLSPAERYFRMLDGPVASTRPGRAHPQCAKQTPEEAYRIMCYGPDIAARKTDAATDASE